MGDLVECRKTVDELHATLLQAIEARRAEDENAIRALLEDEGAIDKKVDAVNAAFVAVGLGEPFYS